MHIERQAEQYGDLNGHLAQRQEAEASTDFSDLLGGPRIQVGHNLLAAEGDDCPCCGEDPSDCSCAADCEGCSCSGKTAAVVEASLCPVTPTGAHAMMENGKCLHCGELLADPEFLPRAEPIGPGVLSDDWIPPAEDW